MFRFFAAILMTAMAQMSATDRIAITNYQSVVQIAQAGRTPRGIENAFNSLVTLEQTLIRGNPSLLESLSNDEFQQLERQLPGALLNRDEILFLKPDPDFFAKLATVRGDEADKRFFAGLKATYPDAVWPVYVEQQTDYSGCTTFGSGKLVETYRRWLEFRSAFPNRYVEAATKELQSVSEALLSTCPCEDMSVIQRELARFVQTFPGSPLRARIEQVMTEIQMGKSNIRPRCHSG